MMKKINLEKRKNVAKNKLGIIIFILKYIIIKKNDKKRRFKI